MGPDKIPSEAIKHADLLWIKGRPKITAAKILSVVCQTKHLDPKDIVLRIAEVLPLETRRLSDLDYYQDKVIAVEAIYKAQLSARLARSQPEPSRRPLQDVSNLHIRSAESSPSGCAKASATPNTATPKTRGSLQFKSSNRVTNASPSPHMSRRSTAEPVISSSRPIIEGPVSTANTSTKSTYPPLSHPDMDDATLVTFMDFASERREVHRRFHSMHPKSIEQTEADTAQEWNSLGQVAKSHFKSRAFQIARKATFIGSIPHGLQLICSIRSFWTFYYLRLEQERRVGLDPHRDAMSHTQFFERILSDWDVAPLPVRLHYMNSNIAELVKDPIKLPDPVPEQAVASGSDAGDHVKAKQEVRGSDSVHSAPGLVEPAVEAPQLFNIRDLFAVATPEELEKGTDAGVQLLDRIRNTLSSQEGSQDITQWIQNINNVAKQAERSKTVVGVVGNTGAGKSSVINAILEEERLVPTNCMRACTAVVTEISYNFEETPYRAEIEFITVESWKNELNVLFQDLLDGNGSVSRESANEDTEAGVAYAKIKAVYPKLTKEDIAHSSVEKLMKNESVSRLLGSCKSFSSSDGLKFYKDLQYYVDSKEKSTGRGKDKEKDKKPREMEFWPLIKVVRLYVKADALSTGAVIVDLPGVHDSNQARAAVAQGYMKQCTGLWIVAPITRAVDDKAAKFLLGESFKRQLKMDGGFSTVTFICSKTDDISLTEAQDSLGLEQEMGDLWRKSDQLNKEKKFHQQQVKDLTEAKDDFGAALEAADEELDVWEKLKDDLSDGLTVYAPKSGFSKKRKRGSNDQACKRSKRESDDSDGDFSDDESGSEIESEKSDDEDNDRRVPLTDEDIQTKISELKTTKKEGRRERLKLDDSIKAVRAKVSGLQAKLNEIEAEMSSICISGRNDYSKGAIQQDFASGIKELDQELAEEEDAANFNPDIDARDYDAVARSLPVFCVSSRAYQKLQGRLKKDSMVPGFKNINETEVPQLQAHCKKLTEAGRQATSRRFLNSLSQLLNSLKLWSSSDGTNRNMSVAQRGREAAVLQDRFQRLDNDIERAIKSVCMSVRTEFHDQIYDQFDTAIHSAINAAEPTVNQWGAPVNRADRAAGGLHYMTYKAICRRDGVYTNAQGLHDFNTQLTDPMLKVFAPNWERCFNRRVPSIMADLSHTVGIALDSFHKITEDQTTKNGGSIATFQMLKQQLHTYKQTFKDIGSSARDDVIKKQKDINREFTPVIAQAMAWAYDSCTAESGSGSFMRMRNAMSQHVGQEKNNMFYASTQAVQNQLKKMVSGVEEDMLAKADEVFMAIKRDYTSAVLGDNSLSSSTILPRGQRVMREDVLSIVEDAERIFERVAAGKELDEEEQDGSVAEEDSNKADLKVEDAPTSESVPKTEHVETSIFDNDHSSLPHTPADRTSSPVKREPSQQNLLPPSQNDPQQGLSTTSEPLSSSAIPRDHHHHHHESSNSPDHGERFHTPKTANSTPLADEVDSSNATRRKENSEPAIAAAADDDGGGTDKSSIEFV